MSFAVTSVSPGFNATGVYLDAVVDVTFNDDVLASSVTSLTFSLVEADTNIAVDAAVSVIGNSQIRLTPDSDLKANTRYMVVVVGNTWGVLSAGSDSLPDTVSWTFDTGLFLDASDAVDEVPTAVDPALKPTGKELYLVSSNPDNMAVGVLSDKVVMTFTDILPADTAIEVDATHPLGYPAGKNYWADTGNIHTAVDGTELTVHSSGDLAESLSDSVEFIDNEESITEGEILVSESGAIESGLFPATFGIDPNFRYTIRVKIPTNKFTPEITFVSKFIPQLITVEELRLFSGSVLSRFNDFTLSTLLYKTSLTAKGIWESHGHTWPTTTPYYAKEYVLARAQRDMLAIIIRDAGSPGGASKSLGDLRLGGRTDSDSLIDDLRSLELLVTMLGEKLTGGNTSSRPIIGPSWAEAAKKGGTAVIGSTIEDASGRPDPADRTDWTRELREQTRRNRS